MIKRREAPEGATYKDELEGQYERTLEAEWVNTPINIKIKYHKWKSFDCEIGKHLWNQSSN